MSRTLETKQKKEYNRLKGWWDPCLKTWGFEKFMPWVTQSHCLRREKYARTVSKTHQESQCFGDFECRSTYFQTVFTSTSPIPREYNQTLLYGHPLNTDTSFITDWTVCFIPGEKSPYIFSELNPLNTDTLLIRTFSVSHFYVSSWIFHMWIKLQQLNTWQNSTMFNKFCQFYLL